MKIIIKADANGPKDNQCTAHIDMSAEEVATLMLALVINICSGKDVLVELLTAAITMNTSIEDIRVMCEHPKLKAPKQCTDMLLEIVKAKQLSFRK